MSRPLTGIALAMLIVAMLLASLAYDAALRLLAAERTAGAERSVSRYVVSPVWPHRTPERPTGAAGQPRPQGVDSGGDSMRLKGPGISRDRQIRV